ncbi:MAG TPA: DNA-formamidopyrimidine glycosylase family protein [bacterium]|jgi:formamidopyrimidine-DNA glycosylase|nr:DNA-formamidopyrimidine glycosylase family protein [bacterium]
MPELPFIQILTENLDAQIRGRTITAARVKSPSVLKTYDPPVADIVNHVVSGVRRVGKLVVVELNELAIVTHLMRNGRLQIVPSRQGQNKDVAFVLSLDDGRDLRLYEIGPKKRAAAYVMRSSDLMSSEPLGGLGIDPLSENFTRPRLAEMLKDETAQLKRFLTLQRYLTSIGNTFSDEILWEARLSPFVAANRLKADEVARLFAAIGTTLARALDEHREAFLDKLPVKEPLELLRVHRHGGEPCPRCGTPIAAVHFTERETYYCPQCQTGGKVYADRRLSRLLK